MAKQNGKILGRLSLLVDNISIAEMRQCKFSAQGIGAARMAACFFSRRRAPCGRWVPSKPPSR
eukprot:4058480-Pyramimonas_sp.AAC.1